MWRLHQALLLLLLSFSLAKAGPLQRQDHCQNVAQPHSRPYMAALLTSKPSPDCGAFLVGAQWVMTSARCQNVRGVFLGARDFLKRPYGEYYSVSNTYQHPNYMFKNNTFSNDILLLKLHSKVRMSRKIGILPLPPANSHLSDGTPCSVAGWGLNQTDCPKKLYEAKVNIYNQRKCQKFYPKIDHGKICAGERERSQDFRQGEMGDPLVCNGVVHGILSYSNPCPPAVYTDIAKYLPWIKETMAK